jgi:hypothetical protein
MIEILSQRELERGWAFDVQTVAGAEGGLRSVTLLLSFADYNRWSADGADRPEAVAEAVMSYLLSRRDADSLPPRLDASTVRRQFGDADAEIPRLIRR